METKLKLEISQLKNYLGTGLKILDGWGDIRSLKYTHLDDEGNEGQIFGVKPIMYRLSDLDKHIPELGFVPLKKLHDKYDLLSVNFKNKSIGVLIDTCDYSQKIDFIDSYDILQKLFQWNFWVFDQEYFEQGLIIDKLK